MAVDFTPEMKPYTGQGKFRYWVQMVLPTIYDDSLSYMELLNKVVYVINLAIDDVNAVEDNVAALLTAFEELQQFTNNYFDNLDVQEEIDNKLDEMVSDGTFSTILQPLIQNYQVQLDLLEARVDNLTQTITPGTTSGDAEIIDARVGYNGTVYPNLGDAIREQVGGLNNACDEITEKIQSANIYNGNGMTSGSFINENNGNVEIGNAYSYSDYADVSNMESLYFSSNNSLTISIRYAFYDENKNYINGEFFSATGDYDSENRRYYHSVATNGAKYLRYSFLTARVTESTYFMVGGSYAYRPYVNKLIPLHTNTIDALDNYVIGNDVLKATSNTLAPGTTLALDDNNIRSDTEIVFIANVTNFNRIDIGKFTGTSPEYGVRFAITQTGITWITNNTPSKPIPHGLTIKDYIRISIKVRYDGTYDIRIDTNGGTYTRLNNASWNGWYGRAAAYVVGNTSLTNCVLMQIITGLQSNVWFIGDSYLSYANVRWPYYMYEDGIDNILVDSLPGRNTMSAYGILQNLLQYGHPQYIVWALGMNDSDTPGLPNASWQVYTTNFINDCITNGITPVLCTIPNTLNERNVEKNNFVKASRCKYIDFAKFVNAETAGSGWYDGMLSSDGTHPTEEGAKALYNAVLHDFPEIYNKRLAE